MRYHHSIGSLNGIVDRRRYNWMNGPGTVLVGTDADGMKRARRKEF